MKTCPKCGFDNNPDEAVSCRRCDTLFKAITLTPMTPVSVVDIDIPFGSMVVFMVKWAIATIPAFLILFVIALVLMAIVGGV